MIQTGIALSLGSGGYACAIGGIAYQLYKLRVVFNIKRNLGGSEASQIPMGASSR